MHAGDTLFQVARAMLSACLLNQPDFHACAHSRYGSTNVRTLAQD
jgi:hypothetical protein